MSVLHRGSFPKDLLPGINGWFDAAHKEVPAQYKEIFKDARPSKYAFEEEVAFADLDLLVQKGEGDSISADAPVQMYTSRIAHNAYARKLVITHEAMMDGQTLKIAEKQAKMLGKALGQTKNVIGANVLNRAFTAGYTGGDGKVLCATDHPIVGSTMRNKLSTDAVLSETSLEQALIDIRDIRNNRGLRALLSARKLIVPPEVVFDAERLLVSPGRPDSADNDINAARSRGDVPEGYAVMDFLTDSDAWFLVTDAEDGMVHYEREAPSLFEHKDDDTMNMNFALYTRFSMGWHDPRAIFGTSGA